MAEIGGTPPVNLDRSIGGVYGVVGSRKPDPACGRGTLSVSQKKLATTRKRKGLNQKVAAESSPKTGGDCSALKEAPGVYDVMLEFDQFVQYHDMKKKTEEFVSSQEKNLSQGRSSSSQEKDQQNEVGSVTDEAQIQTVVEDEKYDELILVANDITTEEVRSISVIESGSPSSTIIVNTETANEQDSSEEASVPSDDGVSIKDSDEELTENETKPEENLFPTPDEMENTSTPEVGKVFSSLEEAVRFVNTYAHISGFGIKKGRNYKNRKITICCSKSRKSVSNVAGVRKRRRNVVVRTNCQMHVTVSLQDGKWLIISQDLAHNHDLVCSPMLTKFFLSHRNMNEAEKLLSRLLQEHRVKPRKIMSIFRKLCGGKLGNITFDVKKLDNLKQEDREKRRNTDIEHTLEYIEKLQIDKPGFIYKAQRNSSNSVLNLFWTDSRSRLDYLLFGDIISFDTTFSTNKYNMPFAPIIGVNGHSRTIVFGWALLQNEKANTFKWLFETFVEVMGGKKPRVVLTDQDAAMKIAVPKVFPDAFHRFCIWHVRRKARENLSVYMSIKKGLEQDLDYCIMQSMTIEEFEKNWKEMELKYSCGKHAHIKRMWDNREYLVPAYFQGVFCPFIRSTSRSESFNSNFKDYVLRKDTIEIFLRQYEIFQENVIHIEVQDRFLSNEKVPIMWGYQRVERHAAEIYTRAIYTKFLTEMLNSTAFGVNEIVKNESYELKRNFVYENPEFDRETFAVQVNREKEEFVCNCGKFQRDGILCCHILRLFTQFDMLKIPDQYIVPRWTREFREKELLKHKFNALCVHAEDQSHNAVRYAIMMNQVGEVCSDISHDSGFCQELMDAVNTVHSKFLLGKQQPAEGNKNTQQTENEAGGSMPLKDPAVINNKSVRKGNRLKTRSKREGWKKAAEKRKKSI